MRQSTTCRKTAMSLVAATVITFALSSTTNAQPWNGHSRFVPIVTQPAQPRRPAAGMNHYHQQQFRQESQLRQNYGHRQQIDWQVQKQFSHQNPRAALVGGILGAVAAGLQSGNAQKNAGAVNVLGSLSGTFNQLSGPQYREQGQLALQQQGYFNQTQNHRSQFQQRGGYNYR